MNYRLFLLCFLVVAVNLDEGVVLTDDDSIDIAWDARTNAGTGPILCSTDRSATKVIEAKIDGVEVSL